MHWIIRHTRIRGYDENILFKFPLELIFPAFDFVPFSRVEQNK